MALFWIIVVLSVLVVITTFMTLWNTPVVGFFIKLLAMAILFGGMIVGTVWWALT